MAFSLVSLYLLLLSASANAFTTSDPRALHGEALAPVNELQERSVDHTKDDHTTKAAEMHVAAIKEGMNPHSHAGQDANDPRLFKYKFAHHDPLADRLTYYEYEAKHRSDLQVLSAEHVHDCQMGVDGSQEHAHVNLHLRAAHAAGIANDGLVVLPNSCMLPDGTTASLYGKVIAKSSMVSSASAGESLANGACQRCTLSRVARVPPNNERAYADVFTPLTERSFDPSLTCSAQEVPLRQATHRSCFG